MPVTALLATVSLLAPSVVLAAGDDCGPMAAGECCNLPASGDMTEVPRLEGVCCCELRETPGQVLRKDQALVTGTTGSNPAGAPALTLPPGPPPTATCSLTTAAPARAPPLGGATLLSLHTSHLI